MPPRRHRGRSSPKSGGTGHPGAEHLPAASGTRERGDGESRGWQMLLVSAGLLLAAVFACYGQAAGFDFILLDDPVYVSNNLHVQQGLSLRNVAWSFDEFHDSNWIPFTWLSLMLDAQFSGASPRGYHLTNVLLHAANACLLLAFLTRATKQPGPSAVVAGLFALHPLHVESVAWVTERKDVLSTLFGLLSLVCYVNYAKGGRVRSLAAALAWYACSLLSKPTLVTLPFVFLLLDYWPLRRGFANVGKQGAALEVVSSRKLQAIRLLAEKTPFFVLSAAICVVAFVAQTRGHAAASLSRLSLTARAANALAVYAMYLKQTVWPVCLSVYYPHPGERIAWGVVALSGALLLAISVLAVAWAKRLPFLFVGWAWYLGTLVPMIGLVQVGRQQMADRYTYFPLIGLCVAIVWLIGEWAPAGAVRARVLPAVAVALLAAFGVSTFLQVGYWRDSVTLFRHAVKCGGNNPLATSALGYALLSQGQSAEGVALLEAAVGEAPQDAQTQFNAAVGLQSQGRWDEAAEHYRAALALDERDADAHTNLGVLLCQRQQYPAAKEQFLRAVQINPEHVKAYVNLGTLCLEVGQYEEAIRYCERALALDPKLPAVRQNLERATRKEPRTK